MAPPGARKEVPTMRVRSLLRFPVVVALATVVVPSSSRAAEAKVGAAWDSVSAILQTKDAFAGGYHRFNLPRRDLTLRVGDVTVAPELALGAWAGFSDDPDMAMLMGDLVLQSTELGPVLAELAAQKLWRDGWIGRWRAPRRPARSPRHPPHHWRSTVRSCSAGSVARAAPTAASRRSRSCSSPAR
jgi:hypothetical protein